MVREGKSIIFISHKLDEVLAIADRVTVLRKGKVSSAGVMTEDTTKKDLAELMVGREVLFRLEKAEKELGKKVLEIDGVSAQNDKGLPALRQVTMDIRSGEIVGLAGVAGNGQRELAQVITGMRQPTEGCIRIHGRVLVGEGCEQPAGSNTIRSVIEAGVSHIPEDRTHVGTAPNLSVTDNAIMKGYRKAPIARGWSIDGPTARAYAQGLKEAYDIMVPTVETQARLLSGGNLQRLILAREISSEPKIMVAMQPTRGLDVGAIESVQRLLLDQRENGAAILLVSEELEELITLSDRIYVIYEGEIMGETKEENPEKIGLMMTGTRLDEIESAGEARA
jgi:simple sugar transport system ATP-binding protein